MRGADGRSIKVSEDSRLQANKELLLAANRLGEFDGSDKDFCKLRRLLRVDTAKIPCFDRGNGVSPEFVQNRTGNARCGVVEQCPHDPRAARVVECNNGVVPAIGRADVGELASNDNSFAL